MPDHTPRESAILGYNSIANTVKTIEEVIAKNPKRDELVKKLKDVKAVLNLHLPVIHGILSESGPTSYSHLEKENARLTIQVAELKAQVNGLTTQVSTLEDYGNVVTKVQDVMDGWKNDFDVVDSSIKREVKEVVKDNLKTVLKEAVDKIVNTEKMRKTFAEVVSNSQGVIRTETKKCFEQSLTSALKESQSEIVAQTSARQEADSADKEKRIRNVVITTVPESTLTDVKERIAADKLFAAEVLEISPDDIERCYRAGPPLGSGSNRDRTRPRPLVVVLTTPEMAKNKHKYGNGCRVNRDSEQYWINPDLSGAERRANFEARQKRRERTNRSDEQDGSAENSDNVATA